MEKTQKTKKQKSQQAMRWNLAALEATGSGCRCAPHEHSELSGTGQDRWNTEKCGRPSPAFNPPFIFSATTRGSLEKQHVGGRAERKRSLSRRRKQNQTACTLDRPNP